MSPLDLLVARVRGEYREMPGLHLTFAQACRLWQLDAATCEIVLHALVDEGSLSQRQDGSFIASSARVELKIVKAALTPTLLRRGA